MGAMRARPRAATLMAFIACQAIGSIPLAGVAAAHVKWFVTCEPSDRPVPMQAVLTERLLLFSALFISLFYVACKIEQAAIGAPGDSDPELSQDAIRALSRWGSVDAEKASGRDWSGFIRSGPAAKPNSAPHRPARVRVRAALPWNRP